MTILFVTDQYPPAVNGIVTHILTVREELQRRGHRVIVSAPSFGVKEKEPDILRYTSFPFPLRKVDWVMIPFNKSHDAYLLSQDIDIVHNHLSVSGIIGHRIARKLHVPAVTTLHTLFTYFLEWSMPWLGPLNPPIARFAQKTYFNHFDMALAPSQKAVTTLKASGVHVPIRLAHLGIKDERFRTATGHAFREKFRINPKDKLIITSGRIDKGKNVDLDVKAFAKTLKDFPYIKLALIGDGPQKKEIELLVGKLGITDSVIFTGFLSQNMIASAYHAGSIFLFASNSDTSPTVMIEAQTCGLPVVTVNDEAVIDQVVDGKNAILTPFDADKLADGLKKLLGDESLRKAYGEYSKQNAKHFTIEACVDRLEEIYKEAVERKKKR